MTSFTNTREDETKMMNCCLGRIDADYSYTKSIGNKKKSIYELHTNEKRILAPPFFNL
jgi:hypothetical protein